MVASLVAIFAANVCNNRLRYLSRKYKLNIILPSGSSFLSCLRSNAKPLLSNFVLLIVHDKAIL